MYPVVEDYILSKDRICNEHFGYCTSPIIEKLDLNQVVDNILATKPVTLKNDDYIQNLYDEIAASTSERPILRALHLSDIHIDMEYAEGSLANCKEYLCCRADVGYPKRKGDEAAGEWGSPLCDLPVKTF